jgi:hypothetical protein
MDLKQLISESKSYTFKNNSYAKYASGGTSTLPWLVVAKKAVPMIGKILYKLKDRDFGFLSAFERFGPEFEDLYEIDRKKEFSGDASLVYSWSVEE